MAKTVPCKMKHAANKNAATRIARLTPACTGLLNKETFSNGMHPQRYLIGADRENSTLINYSLVC
jgi:hypothetical protein